MDECKKAECKKKRKKGKLFETIQIRCSLEEKNILRTLAELYSNGNMSAYIIDRVIYGNRKVIESGDFELSNRRLKTPLKRGAKRKGD